ncbi:MAG: penicillin-binding transpeptidase domain-containing protein [Chromatiales bacterium]|nr:penicillin-binding transpeptidase domain-containing protein [Chromatiales bacterium]MDH4015348.1 penicillin-binding transpeptidase domain-containing protein [Chromatiales bacterium]
MKRTRKKTKARTRRDPYRLRVATVLIVFALVFSVLIARAVDLQILRRDFHDGEAKALQLRVVEIAARRGPITDRNDEPLAVSSPVDTIFAVPAKLAQARERIPELAEALGRSDESIMRDLSRYKNREFMYLKRHLAPETAAGVMRLKVPGVNSQREYRRFYPAAEVTGHVVGFTNIDGEGIEGLEWAYDDWLLEQTGRKRVIKDRRGNVVEDVEQIEPAISGRPLAISIDLRIQYMAYRELKAAVARHKAKSASAVVIDVDSGEVLAMVNQPAFNPNSVGRYAAATRRNRAVVDVFEPGSSIKPFIVAAALESGSYGPASMIDTTPGYYQVGRKTIRDKRNLGRIDLTTILTKSSNVGASKLALSLQRDEIWSVLARLGFGSPTASGFPGESGGLVNDFQTWRDISVATLSYGYGLSVTTLQLAQAYATIGALGVRRPVSLLRLDERPAGERALSANSARMLIDMMETVVTDEGTGGRAAVPGYRVAGKTGTAWKSTAGGYSEDRYLAVFAGVAPAGAPRLAVVVVMDEPSAGEFYGGIVAAPVFSRVAAGALRMLAVPPDDVATLNDTHILQAMEAHR